MTDQFPIGQPPTTPEDEQRELDTLAEGEDDEGR